MEEKKQSIWFQKLDLAFVYLIIFIVGLSIVLFMTSYLNNKVKEFNQEAVVTVNNK